MGSCGSSDNELSESASDSNAQSGTSEVASVAGDDPSDDGAGSELDEDAADPYLWDMFLDDGFRSEHDVTIDETVDEGDPDETDLLTLEESQDGDGEQLVGDEPEPDLDPCSLLSLEDWANIVGKAADQVEQIPLEYGEVCGYLEQSDTQRVAIGIVKWFNSESDQGASPQELAELRYGNIGQTTSWESITVDQYGGLFATGVPVAKSSLVVVTLDEETDLVIEVSSVKPDASVHRQLGVKVADIAVQRSGW